MQTPRTWLGRSSRPLVEEYDAALVDLDGVVYVGSDAVPGAADALARARSAGMGIAFVTNNASRTPDGVVAHLLSVGVDASPDQVATSAQAAVRLLGERIAPGSSVLVVGGRGLVEAAAGAGYGVVPSADDAPAAVLQGYTPETTYAELAEAALAIRDGALWVAANTDATMPSPRGQLPGNGALVAALVVATGRSPLVAGKPEPALHAESIARVRATRPLVVGDRLDTDIEGAVRAGCDSLLVLTGVTDVEMLMSAPPLRRPTYVAADLRGMLLTHRDGMGDGLDDVRAGIEAAWAALSGNSAASE